MYDICVQIYMYMYRYTYVYIYTYIYVYAFSLICVAGIEHIFPLAIYEYVYGITLHVIRFIIHALFAIY